MIATNKRTGEAISFRTDSPEVAAARLGRKLRVIVYRATGDSGLSGVFQGYRRLPDGGLTSHGDNWHIGT